MQCRSAAATDRACSIARTLRQTDSARARGHGSYCFGNAYEADCLDTWYHRNHSYRATGASNAQDASEFARSARTNGRKAQASDGLLADSAQGPYRRARPEAPLYIHISALITTNNCILRAPDRSCTSTATERENNMVAVIEDDESYRVAVQRLLKSAGFSVQSFASAEDFLSSGRQHETGCLITDIRMPGMSGLDLQAKLNADRCPIPTIFITAHGDEEMRLQAMRGGAVKFMVKPFDGAILLESVRVALEG